MKLPNEVIQYSKKTLNPILSQWNTKHQLPPVLLFYGPEGVGKKEIACYFSQWLYCTQRDGNHTRPPEENDFKVCHQCSFCIRFQSSHMLDFTLIGSEDKIKIDQIRTILEKQGFGPSEAPLRIFCIPNAENLTPQAANALLKVLEEPPRNWLFILTVQHPSMLLPTITSRCQKIKFTSIPIVVIEKILNKNSKNLTPEQIKTIATISQGLWKKALEMMDDSFWENRKKVFSFFASPQKNISSLLDWTSKTPENFSFLINQVELITHDLILWTLSEKKDFPTSSFDGKEALEKHVQQLEKKLTTSKQKQNFWISRIHDISKTRKKISLPLNKKILIQELLFPWIENST